MSMFSSLLLKKKKDAWPGLRFTALEASTVSISLTGTPDISNLKTRKNNGEWSPVTAGESISLSTGDYIDYWNESTTLSTGSRNYVRFVMSGKLAASGNIMSCLNFTDACHSHCFRNLFHGCSSLVTAPELPSTSLSIYCYYGMFSHTGIRTAPELPSTSLSSYCYERLFMNSNNLNSIEVNFTQWESSFDSTQDWVYGVASSGTFTCPSSLPEEYGINRIPEGWTVIRK